MDKSLAALLVSTMLAAPALAAGWTEKTSVDEMRGTTTTVRTLESLNAEETGRNGKQKLTLSTVNKTTVVVGAGAGILRCAIRCLITVKFDDEKPGVWLAYKDGAGDTPLLLDKGAQFSKRLGKAKKVMVEVDFWQGTFRQYTFKP